MAIDYSLPNSSEAIMQGLKSGLTINALQQNKIDAENKAQRTAQMQADLSSVFSKPVQTPQDIARLTVLYPEMNEQFKQAWDVLDAGAKQNRLRQASEVYAALEANQPGIAVEKLRGQAEASLNSGNKAESDSANTMADLIEQDPRMAKSSVAIRLASMMGPDKFTDTFEKLQSTDRQQALQQGELDKQAADLGLTKATTNKVLKEAEKLGADAKVALLKLEAVKQGVPDAIADPKDKLDAENKLRDDYFSQTKDFRSVQEAYRRIGATEDTAAGDLSLIFSYMKMLDPGSVVREGEFATAQNAAGVPERMINIYNNLLTGERLSPGQRKSFIGQGKKLFDAAGKSEKEVRSLIEKSAKTYGLNKGNIFPNVEPAGMPNEPGVIEPPANLTPEQLMQEADKILQGGK